MKSENINRMFQRHLNPSEALLYPEFLNDLCKIIVSTAFPFSQSSICHFFWPLQVTDFTDKVNFYIMNAVTFFKSMWSQVKANAALLVGKNTTITTCGMYFYMHVFIHRVYSW